MVDNVHFQTNAVENKFIMYVSHFKWGVDKVVSTFITK